MKELVQQLVGSIRRLFTQPLSELNRWQLTVRYAVGIARYGAHELREDRASQMAAALTYRTIFSLIPVFVLSLLVFNAFGGFESVGGNLRDTIYDYLGLSDIQIEEIDDTAEDMDIAPGPPVVTPEGDTLPSPYDPSTDGADTPANAQTTNAAPTAEETQARVDQLLTNLQNQVASVDFTSIGLVGLALLIWAAISLVVSLENCFNRVYHAPQGRPWHLRVTIYWAVITLGPVLLALSFYVTNQLIATAQTVTGGAWLLKLLTPSFSLAATWLLLILIYKLLPAAKVQLRAALIGALVAAIMWELSKLGFRFYVQRAVGYSRLYGSLGLVPLFLLWLYVTWIVILFGLEISYIVQTVKGSRFIRQRPSDDQSDAIVDSSAILAVATAFAKAFDRGQTLGLTQLTTTTGLPARAVSAMVRSLHHSGHLHLLEADDENPGEYILARPAEMIPVAELLGIARDTATRSNNSRFKELVAKLQDAQQQATRDQTLRDLVGPSAQETPTD
ncbi:YihY/virulence factor BrkB family protein [Algisphaera agarilytica]|uniref:Membrane protein n=1 Tax=Algisphaera agarilytica TaxID=1385975 RepID=A0A7X0HAA6_9BACT|nr:YihY/virulence factor BrkB family protein [Algisphaera agarilytica]MBB6430674.1 membrane protein [Algisphaera agarilytica]